MLLLPQRRDRSLTNYTSPGLLQYWGFVSTIDATSPQSGQKMQELLKLLWGQRRGIVLCGLNFLTEGFVLQAPNSLIVSWFDKLFNWTVWFPNTPLPLHFLFLWNVTPVHAAFAQRHKAKLKDPVPRKARVPLTMYSCVWVHVVTLSNFDPLCYSPFFPCDKHACPLDPPGGLRTAVSHEPFWQAHFEGFRMWWQGVLATRLCERVCVFLWLCVCVCV